MATDDSTYREWKRKSRTAHLPFDVNNWLPILRDITFDTTMVDMSIETAEAFIRCYQHLFCRRSPPSPADITNLNEFGKELEAAVPLVCTQTPPKVFVRLTSRSPKDAGVITTEAFEARLARHMSGIDEEADPVAAANAKILAWSDITWGACSVSSGREAVMLLLGSERVFTDLLEATAALELFDVKVCLRDWQDGLRHDLEFRGFVHNNTFTALSQYNHYAFFPRLAAHRDTIVTRLREFFETEVQPRLAGVEGLESYIVDFGFIESGESKEEERLPGDGGGTHTISSGRLCVIELNPFDTGTGAGLFDWKVDRDQLEGRKPFEFRCHTGPVAGLADSVDALLEDGFRLGKSDRGDIDALLKGEVKIHSAAAAAAPAAAPAPTEAADTSADDDMKCSVM